MRAQRSGRLLALLLAAALLLGGCSVDPAERVSPEPTATPSASPPTPARTPEPTPEPTPSPEPSFDNGSGEFTDPGELTAEQQDIILDYMTRYYDSLATLSLHSPDELFHPDATLQLAANRIVWEYVIEYRAAQAADLSLAAYAYSLECTSVDEEGGSVTVRIVENTTQNFSASPDADTEIYDITHIFILSGQTDGSWLIASHLQMDSTYWSVLGRRGFNDLFERGGTHESELVPDNSSASDGMTDAELIEYFTERKLSQLAQRADAAASRLGDTGEHEPVEYTDEYDRAAAVAYALEWTHERNGDWYDYTRVGGNCQNYVSQCLYAGGIPMDTQTPGLWKWYGDTPNNTASRSGRSAAWTAVQSFRVYVEANSGYGLAATLDAPYFSGEPGDILQVGNEEGEWRHTVIITEVIRDEDGNTIDYLVCSNTTDIKNYPASIYSYLYHTLIKIHGRNS